MSRFNRLSRMPRLVLALAVAGATFGIVTVVQAAIPDSNGTIHGCYQFANASVPKGTLRVVDTGTGESCRFYERPLNWNSKGIGGVYAISGQVDEEISGEAPIPANDPDWRFVAQTATVTVGPNQSILANVTASLGLQPNVIEKPTQKPTRQKAGASKIEPSFNEFGFGVCFQNTIGGGEQGSPVVNMNQFTGGNNDNYAAASYEQGEQDYTGIGVAAPGAGTYNVGFCVQNYGEFDLDNNSWANGYAEVVDGTPNTSGVSQDHPRSD
jgi:hypothetical protein